jgi:hypothetical protein
MSTSQRRLLAGSALLAIGLLGCTIQPGPDAPPSASVAASGLAATPSQVAPSPQSSAGSQVAVSAQPPGTSQVDPSAQPSGNVYNTTFSALTSLTAQPTGMYVSWSTAGPSKYPPSAFLTRFAAATGQTEATRSFGPAFTTTPVAAAGWLWTVLSRTSGAWLLRLDPLTLATTGTVRLTGTAAYWDYGAQQMAYAGGGIWVAGAGRLVRVSPASMTVTQTITLPARSADSSADGQVLIVSEAGVGSGGTIERRDPVTGALLASYPVAGITAPSIEAVTGSGVWMAQATGMLGYVERLTTTLAPQAATVVHGTNAIRAAQADGTLWLTGPPGVQGLEYCADPVTGQRIASIPLPDPGQDTFAAVDSSYVYYTYYSGGAHVARAQVPAACVR